MAMELSPNMGAGLKQFGTNYGVFYGHFLMPETVILVQVEPVEFMYSTLDLCATVSCLEICEIFQFPCVIFLIDNMLFCMRNGRNACYFSELEIWGKKNPLCMLILG